MAFVAEDGHGFPEANSYASVQQWTDFANLRGIAIPDNAAIEGALVRATDWIDSNYAEIWLGYPTFAEQGLGFPRTGLVGPAGVVRPLGYMPPQLVKATCILAVEALKGALYNNNDPANTGGQITEETTGPITTKYSQNNPLLITKQKNFDEVRQTLSPLTRGAMGLVLER